MERNFKLTIEERNSQIVKEEKREDKRAEEMESMLRWVARRAGRLDGELEVLGTGT
jgi:hypothetical protein